MGFKYARYEFLDCDLLGSHQTLSLLWKKKIDPTPFTFSHKKCEEVGRLMGRMSHTTHLKKDC
jgi:hypothetical protein